MELDKIRCSNISSPWDLTQINGSVRIGYNVVEIGELRLRGEEEGVAELGGSGGGTVDFTEVDFGGRASKVFGSGEENSCFL